MYIQTEETPNPNSLKFLPGFPVSPKEVYNITSKEEADISPLAKKLFDIDGVTQVFLGSNFISITKTEKANWDILRPLVLSEIMDFFVTGFSVVSSDQQIEIEEFYNEEDIELVKQIKELIEVRVRPSVAMDGGDIIFRGYKDGIVKLQLRGSCAGCPSSIVTLKEGIENMLKYYVPEVESVEAMDEEY
jgi:Fe-S cluster biogenesis protein NfuA